MNIQYICFTSYSDFAFSAKNNIKALIRAGFHVSIKPLDLGFTKVINTRDFKFFKALENDKSGDVQIYHCIPMMQRRVPYTGRVLGYGTYENDVLPQEWINILQKNDDVIVPSLFNWVNSPLTLKNVIYIPHCLDFTEYSYYDNRDFPVYKFLFFGTWKHRKNYETLIEAFMNEFSNENVELTLKVNNEQLNNPKKYISRIEKQLKKTARIKVDNRVLKDEDISNFLQGFNCLVNPTRGEGFGYPGLQAMASGLPTIITDYSGCQEYARTETSLLLSVEGFEKKEDMDGIVQFRNKLWPIISVKQLQEKMRFAYENGNRMKELAKNAYEFVQGKFNYEVVGKRFREIL